MIDFKKYLKVHSPGYVIEIYKDGKNQEFVIGNRETRTVIKECNADTLYDIASLTKVFTATLVYIAYEENKLDINDFIYNIDNRFINLKEVKIIDLLSHNQEIWTDGYLGSVKTKEEFYKILFTAYVKDKFPTYIDVHYIILSTILEKVYNLDYETLLEEKILKKLGLAKTTVNPSGDNIASNNYETLNGKIIDYITPGTIHDTKGRVAKSLGIITGHASIFTTGKELLIFLKSFLDNTLLKPETISLMLKHDNRNKMNYNMLKEIIPDESDINKMYEKAIKKDSNLKVLKTYNFMGTRYFNDILAINDVPNICSKNTITFSGYTGPSFIIDFDKKIIVVILCNVMHNTTLDRQNRRDITINIMNDICNKIY